MRKPTKLSALAVLFGSILLFVLLILSDPGRKLTEVGVKVGQWVHVSPGKQTTKSVWISDSQILEKTVSLSGPRRIAVSVLDLKTNESRPLYRLSKIMQGIGATLHTASPNGGWITLWNPEYALTDALYTTDLQATRLIRWPKISAPKGEIIGEQWWQDSGSFAIMLEHEVLIYGLENPNAVKRVALPAITADARFVGLLDEASVLFAHYDNLRARKSVLTTSVSLSS
jgi:hypothetical protein